MNGASGSLSRTSSPNRNEPVDELASPFFSFAIDLYIKEHRICVEVDGIYHLTKKQEAKAAWRDALLIANGYKVVHVDAYYTRNAEWLSKLRVRLSEVLMKMKRGELQEAKID